MAELVDAPDSKSGSARSVGSIPTRGTQRDKSSFLDLSPFFILISCSFFFKFRKKLYMDLNLFVDAYKSDIEMATNEAKNDLGHNSLFLVALNNVLKEYDSILENLEVEDGMYSTPIKSSLPGDFPNNSTTLLVVSFEDNLTLNDIKSKFGSILEEYILLT